MEQIPMDISLYILRFMITVPDLIWKFSFVQKPWMILQRLDRPIILDMRKNRKVKEPEEMQFQKENAFILMKLMREEGGRPVYTAVSGQESDYEALAASLIDR